MNFKTTIERQCLRQELTDDIIEQVREAVREEMADAPESFSPETLEGIEDSVLAQTQLVVDALSFEEMQSEGGLLSHLANARVETNRLIRDRHLPSKQ
jgi:S-adenosylmethionine:diacylglycerol 3-amino-3-carboxypropyl transferase